MLAAARARAEAAPGLTVVDADLAHIPDIAALRELEVIVANASLHWVPGHPAVLARWRDRLAPGGQVAVQVPANAGHPAHTVAADIGAELLGDAAPPDVVAANVMAPEAYAVVLHELGFVEQHVRLQIYPLVLPDVDALVEWTKGSTLTRFRDRLDAPGFDALVERYRTRLRAELGDPRPCFYPFKRILLWGRLPR
jgi:trans-aconitate 2-methyltransferase